MLLVQNYGEVFALLIGDLCELWQRSLLVSGAISDGKDAVLLPTNPQVIFYANPIFSIHLKAKLLDEVQRGVAYGRLINHTSNK